MRLSKEQLIGLKVETQSNQELGCIADFVIDTDTHKIIQYLIKPNNLVKKITGELMIIHFEQVISLEKDKMIVEDNTVYLKDLIKTKSNKKEAPLAV